MYIRKDIDASLTLMTFNPLIHLPAIDFFHNITPRSGEEADLEKPAASSTYRTPSKTSAAKARFFTVVGVNVPLYIYTRTPDSD